MSCPFCGEEIKGFNDPRSLREYKISGLCQECQDKTFGTGHLQICEACKREIPEGEEIYMSNYALCSDSCTMDFLGI